MNLDKSVDFLRENIGKVSGNKKSEKLTCVWNMGSDCKGGVNTRMMFGGQLEVPVCDEHYCEHVVLMVIRNLMNVDVENLVEAHAWSRVELFAQEFGDDSLSPSVCKALLSKIRAGEKDTVDKLSDKEVYEALIKELPV